MTNRTRNIVLPLALAALGSFASVALADGSTLTDRVATDAEVVDQAIAAETDFHHRLAQLDRLRAMALEQKDTERLSDLERLTKETNAKREAQHGEWKRAHGEAWLERLEKRAALRHKRAELRRQRLTDGRQDRREERAEAHDARVEFRQDAREARVEFRRDAGERRAAHRASGQDERAKQRDALRARRADQRQRLQNHLVSQRESAREQRVDRSDLRQSQRSEQRMTIRTSRSDHRESTRRSAAQPDHGSAAAGGDGDR